MSFERNDNNKTIALIISGSYHLFNNSFHQYKSTPTAQHAMRDRDTVHVCDGHC